MDAMRDIPPNLEDGEFYLPSDVVKEINFGTIQPKAKSNGFCYGNVISDHGGEANVQLVSFVRALSTNVLPNYQGIEEKTEPVLPLKPKYTWAQIVKGEASSHKDKSRGTNGFFQQPRVSLMELHRAKGVSTSLNKQVIHLNYVKKMGGKN